MSISNVSTSVGPELSSWTSSLNIFGLKTGQLKVEPSFYSNSKKNVKDGKKSNTEREQVSTLWAFSILHTMPYYVLRTQKLKNIFTVFVWHEICSSYKLFNNKLEIIKMFCSSRDLNSNLCILWRIKIPRRLKVGRQWKQRVR
jgi:hypothetical protein